MTLNWQQITDEQKRPGTPVVKSPCILVTRLPCSNPKDPPYAVVRWARVTDSRFGWKRKGEDRELPWVPTHFASLDGPPQ